MTLTLNLPPHMEQAYLAEAQLRGVPVADVVIEALEKVRPFVDSSSRTSPYNPAALTPEEWVRELEAWSHRKGHETLPILSDEAMSRDSIYDERGL